MEQAKRDRIHAAEDILSRKDSDELEYELKRAKSTVEDNYRRTGEPMFWHKFYPKFSRTFPGSTLDKFVQQAQAIGYIFIHTISDDTKFVYPNRTQFLIDDDYMNDKSMAKLNAFRDEKLRRRRADYRNKRNELGKAPRKLKNKDVPNGWGNHNE